VSIAPAGRCALGWASRLGRGDCPYAITERPALVEWLRGCMKDVGFSPGRSRTCSGATRSWRKGSRR